jgi:hypothetical protein
MHFASWMPAQLIHQKQQLDFWQTIRQTQFCTVLAVRFHVAHQLKPAVATSVFMEQPYRARTWCEI